MSIDSVAQFIRQVAAQASHAGLWIHRDPQPEGSADEFVPYAALAERAMRVRGALEARALQQGDRIALIVPAAPEAFAVLFGALSAGLAVVPIAPPLTERELHDFGARVRAALVASRAVALVAARRQLDALGDAAVGAPVFALETLDGPCASAPLAAVRGTDAALLQVVESGDGARVRAISHHALIDAVRAASQACCMNDADVLASWLPPLSDAGLTVLLLALAHGRPLALLSTVQFLKRPARWLALMSRVGATISFAPEHGYAYCEKRAPDASLAGLDLSRWRLAGAVEGPIGLQTTARFCARLAGTGLSSDAFTAASAPLPAPVAHVEGPLAAGQEALWFLAQLAPDSIAYNVPLCFRIRSPLSTEALRRTLLAIVTRHAALRTVFPTVGAKPVRAVHEGVALAFEERDARGLDEAALADAIAREVARPFDLAAGPLVVARLFRTNEADAVLLLLAHHINVDALSFLIIGSELSALYGPTAASGVVPALPAPELDYDAFVRHQAELLSGPEGARLGRYWAAQLEGAPRTLALPTDHAYPPRQTYDGAALPVKVAEPLAAALRALAERHGTTLFTVMLAVYEALLCRRAGQGDLVVASPVAGRSGLAFQEVVGYFVNTLPLRARIAADMSFDALVAQLRDTVAGALDHQDLPFSRIVEQVGHARDPRRAPLCQVMFQLQTHRPREGVGDVMRALSDNGAAALGQLMVERYELTRRIAQFELSLDLTDFGAGISGIWEYNTQLFEADTVRGLIDDYLQLAADLTREPGRPIAAHALASAVHAPARDALTDRARDQVLFAWNDTVVRYPAGTVHGAIAAQAVRTPTRIALRFAQETLTYGALDARANRIARHLVELGAGRDVLIGVAMDRSLALVTVLVAILKAGAAYVPLDPTLPRERLAFMLTDAAAPIVVVDGAHRGLVAEGAAEVLTTEALLAIADDEARDARAPACAVRAEDLAYVIYTSGSTGTPKGAGNTHAGLWNRLCWMQDYLGLDADDCVLQKTPISFDVSVWELFFPLMVGARLEIARPLGHRDSRYLCGVIADGAVTTLHFVPSMLEAFLREPDLSAVRTLRRVVCSGEALSYRLMTRFFARLPGVSLHNLYGPTEAAIDVTAWTCAADPERAESGESVPIGRPIANTQIYLLDAALRPVPIGAAGELYIGGVGLARGYHGRPELTRERFIDNPIAGAPSARLYRTGDLARFLSDGTIAYLGRNDDQVKLRGYRIELGEIEAALCAHPAVRAAVVAARPMPSGGTRLEAFVVPAEGLTLHPAALTRALLARLPEYMVPSAIVAVDAIPLTHSGKVDRRALLEREQAPGRGPHVAARGEVEQALAAIWQTVLGVAEPSVHDNFFALGGDSIRSLEVRALAARRGLAFDVQALFEHQTIAALAEHLRETPARDDAAPLAPFALLTEAERAALAGYEDAYPATQLQLGMLYHAGLTEGSWAYHDVMSFELALTRPWCESALRASLEAVIARHPVLRASFDVAGFSRPLMRVAQRVAAPLAVVDLRCRDEAAAQALIDAYVADDKRRGHALSTAPLFRVMVHVRDDARVRLTLSFHHAILDGWSAATLLRELLTGYLQRTDTPGAEALSLPEPSRHRFSELAAREAAAVGSEAARAFWRARLEDSQVSRLPRWPEAARQAGIGSLRLTVEIDPLLSTRLAQVAAALSVPLKATLLAAHVLTIATFTGTDDVLTGRVLHGRPEVDGAERILGLFLNTVPLRLAVGTESWAALIAAIVADEQAVHPHRHFPLREIQRVSGGAAFETAFNFVHFHLYDALAAGGLLQVTHYEAHENTALGLMANFVLSPETGRLSLQLEFDAQEIAEAQVAQLARGYVRALEALAADVQAEARAAQLIDEDEAARLRAARGTSDALAALPVHEAFTAQVARTPDAVAVQCGAATLTYAALDARANQVAGLLRESGARPRSTVAIVAEPSLARAVAQLAVLKAGCAYLPLDPSYPPARLVAMLDAAEVACCLVSPAQQSADFLRGRRVRTVDLSAPAPAPVAARVEAAVQPDDPAYVIFTSGSTGQPKGIVMPHRPLANLIAWQCRDSALPAGTATAHASSFGFDVAFQEVFSTWLAGGRLVIAAEDERTDARALARLLADEAVARLFVPVVMLQQLAEVAEQLGLSLPALREVDTAGEQLEVSPVVRAFFARHPACRLANHYGPSETHVATALTLHGPAAEWPRFPAIGAPLPGVRAYVLDAAGRPAPLGVPGELHLGGVCVATGYVGQPALTAERFVDDPFSTHAGARMYRTGDLARVRTDGLLEYLGRRDAQVKIRGYRVEPAEVEAAIVARLSDRVARAAVIALPSRAHPRRLELAAYVVLQGGGTLSLSALHAALAPVLPAHMLPSTLTILPALPCTPSGKIDRRSLPAPAGEEPASAYVPPEGPLEVALCALWCEVLGVARVGVTDDFFAIGGESLSAVQLMARIERHHGVALPIATLIEARTVRALAQAIEARDTGRAGALIALSGSRDAVRPPVFCVHPVGGNVLCYVALARHLGADQPFYGLSARGLDGRAAPRESVEEMAAAYAREIDAVQPRGPVHLAGWSFGGIVAVEVARTLKARGRTLAPVVVLDTIASVRFRVQPSDDDLFECVAMELFGTALEEADVARLVSRDRTDSQAERFARLTAAARARGILPEGADAAQIEHVFAVIQANIRAAYAHQPTPYAGDIVLLRCLDAMPARLQRLHDLVGSAHDDAQNGWAGHCARLEVVPVRGDHLSIVFEPHVGAVAKILRRIVDDSLAAHAAE